MKSLSMRGSLHAILTAIVCIGSVAPGLALAGFGGMANIESDDLYGGGSGAWSLGFLIPVGIGALVGCYAERAYTANKLKKLGAHLEDGYFLGGKTGAIIGAITGPFAFGMLIRMLG